MFAPGDDRDSCELLREIFCAEGWHVDTALSPTQAFSVAEKEKIDLVVSDINLEANQSGLDLLKDLRAQCPVILVTGFGTSTPPSRRRERAPGILYANRSRSRKLLRLLAGRSSRIAMEAALSVAPNSFQDLMNRADYSDALPS